jgi:methylmalonyl-CoA mutase N-terminal domain/subunit
VETGERVVVGVNRFQQDDERSVPAFRMDPGLERSQIERLQQMRAGRNQTVVRQALEELEAAARDGRNLMPPIFAAAAAYTTVGEISDRLRIVFGEYRES